MQKNRLNLGIDIGSTTLKIFGRDATGKEILKDYRRHYSKINESLLELLQEKHEILTNYPDIAVAFSGSAGLRYSEEMGFRYVQEVIAASKSVREEIPETRTVVELGGEDAKIIYFEETLDHRMNGVCAGGTGAFIDQMAQLLNVTAIELDKLAENHTHIYPIASRCGVFAKSDVQPLLNQGAKKEDVAASIFQAVVTQTIGALSRGKPLIAPLAFLGGPLTFLPQLRAAFTRSLDFIESETICPEDSQYFVAKGAEIEARNYILTVPYSVLIQRINDFQNAIAKRHTENDNLPLFADEKELIEFNERHAKAKAKAGNLENYRGKAYLGIDAGSTTSKMILIGENQEVLYTYYGSNRGKTLETLRDELTTLLEKIEGKITICGAGSTGYGEHLIQAAFGLDFGEVETVAHYHAAKHFSPDVDFVIDIGGQDMKCFKIRNGAIENIILNEACSSGCGSFIETFAGGLGYSIQDFTKLGIESKNPVELGTRCTVFMNSKVKQAQKEGYPISDISAGLALSVVKNTLFKVIRIKDMDYLGKNIVVQGGTFYNTAVLRAFEQVIGKNVIRPDIAGLMGAFGVALIAKERNIEKCSILSLEELKSSAYSSRQARCSRCTNHCTLTVNQFGKRNIISGNKCEKGESSTAHKKHLPDFYEYKYERIFDYKQDPERTFKHGKIGIPRVLGFYENYPFWFTFFDKLGFEVILSPDSTNEILQKGIGSVISDNICYPAKLVHGHIETLIEYNIGTIFYPCITYSFKENPHAHDNFNCPIVSGYAELIQNNLTKISQVKLIKDYLPFDDFNALKTRLSETIGADYKISKNDISKAIDAAAEEFAKVKKDFAKKGEEILKYLEENQQKAIVLVGRPYHIDKEIAHGISRLITSLGFAVLSEDAIFHLAEGDNLQVVDQWVYHSRIFRAAKVVAKNPNLEIVQLNSFGCGLDGVTVDETRRLVEEGGKIYTQIKIDEVSNLGAVKIRLRSLQAFTQNREKSNLIKKVEVKSARVVGSLKKDYTILIPEMSPYHFPLIRELFKKQGYKVDILEDLTEKTKAMGLKHVNNEMCYPALLTIGQIICSLKSGKYDVDKTAVMMSQTGGGCRASNYIVFLRQALIDEGLEQVPVISFNLNNMDDQSIPITIKFLHQTVYTVIYGDLLMKLGVFAQTYEKEKGAGEKFVKNWQTKLCSCLEKGETRGNFKRNIKEMVLDFQKIPMHPRNKPRVGIVGEIYVKYQPFANNELIRLLIQEGAEPITPNIFNFVLYVIFDKISDAKNFKHSKITAVFAKILIWYLDGLRNTIRKAIKKIDIEQEAQFSHLTEMVDGIISISNKMGEGWLLTSEMMELIESGTENIICAQPFGCLPNHICGRGMIKPLKERYPHANILSLDYDPEISFTNQVNRIKLLLASARKV